MSMMRVRLDDTDDDDDGHGKDVAAEEEPQERAAAGAGVGAPAQPASSTLQRARRSYGRWQRPLLRACRGCGDQHRGCSSPLALAWAAQPTLTFGTVIRRPVTRRTLTGWAAACAPAAPARAWHRGRF